MVSVPLTPYSLLRCHPHTPDSLLPTLPLSEMFVVKLGGRTQNDPALPAALAALWRATHGGVVVVHGGGDQISALQRLRELLPTLRVPQASAFDSGCIVRCVCLAAALRARLGVARALRWCDRAVLRCALLFSRP